MMKGKIPVLLSQMEDRTSYSRVSPGNNVPLGSARESAKPRIIRTFCFTLQ